VLADGQTHRQTKTDFIICPMLYAIAMGQIKIIKIDRRITKLQSDEKWRVFETQCTMDDRALLFFADSGSQRDSKAKEAWRRPPGEKSDYL